MYCEAISTSMIYFLLFFCFCLAAGLTDSSLWTLDKHLDCNQPGLDNCKINNCSDKRMVVHRELAPTGPDWDPKHVELDTVNTVVPLMNVAWKIKADASIAALRGSEINIVEESTNRSMCVQYSYSLGNLRNPNKNRWTFSLEKVVVEPGRAYMVSVVNLPEPEIGNYTITKRIIIPGSLWDPHLSVAVLSPLSVRKSIVVGFKTAQYSETYKVSIQSGDFYHSTNVSRENKSLLNVPFEFDWRQLSGCELLIRIQPFFVRCQNDCWGPNKTIDYCQYNHRQTVAIKTTMGLLAIGCCLAYLVCRACQKEPLNTSSSVAKEQPEVFQLQVRKRVLIIYSLDHPLYKNIVLKLCAFLSAKCGIEVVLDLLDSTRLGVLGGIQWLEWHKEQIEKSSDKILILCSQGVKAKWRAMCGDKRVFLREDIRSPVGDMLTPSLSLMVPHFIRSASFKKYIVAYFDDVCSEEDIPSPFNITVRYKLMKQFEEVYFRILDTEKHEPGRVKQIEGLSEDKYHQCPSGKALLDAIEAFHAYQLEHPQWFQDELLKSSELEHEETSDEINESRQSCEDPRILFNC